MRRPSGLIKSGGKREAQALLEEITLIKVVSILKE
jgi:hypothetical protein